MLQEYEVIALESIKASVLRPRVLRHNHGGSNCLKNVIVWVKELYYLLFIVCIYSQTYLYGFRIAFGSYNCFNCLIIFISWSDLEYPM